MKFLQLFLLVFLAALPAAAEEWSGDALRSLNYLYHEADLKNDITAMNAGFQRAYAIQLQRYYLEELNKNPAVISNGLVPLSFENLSQDYQGVYNEFRNRFARQVIASEDGLLWRLENEERQAFRDQLSSEDMVALRDFYLSHPKFFQLLLTYENMVRFSNTVEANPKHDFAERQATAASLAQSLRLKQANYALEGDELHAFLPDAVEKNLTNYLSNEMLMPYLNEMALFAQSEAGQNYLALMDGLFKNRFLALQELYRKQLAQAVDDLRARLNALPPPVIVYQKLFFQNFKPLENPATPGTPQQ